MYISFINSNPIAFAGEYEIGFYLHEFETWENPVENQEFTLQLSIRHSDSSTVYYPPLISHFNIRIGEDAGNGELFTTWTNQNIYRNDDMFFNGGSGGSYSEWKIIGDIDDLIGHDADRIRISFRLYDTSNNIVAEDSKSWPVESSSTSNPITNNDDNNEIPGIGGVNYFLIAIVVVIGVSIVLVSYLLLTRKKPPTIQQPHEQPQYPPPPNQP